MDERSKRNLASVYKPLANVVIEIDKIFPLIVLEGHRGEARQNKLFADKRSKLKFPRSRHNSMPSMAVDCSPDPIPTKWGANWRDRVKFYEMQALFQYEANRQGIFLRGGHDWDMDRDYHDNSFDDLVHVEIWMVDGKRV